MRAQRVLAAPQRCPKGVRDPGWPTPDGPGVGSGARTMCILNITAKSTSKNICHNLSGEFSTMTKRPGTYTCGSPIASAHSNGALLAMRNHAKLPMHITAVPPPTTNWCSSAGSPVRPTGACESIPKHAMSNGTMFGHSWTQGSSGPKARTPLSSTLTLSAGGLEQCTSQSMQAAAHEASAPCMWRVFRV